MSNNIIDNGGGAFPLYCGAGDTANTIGMTMRDYFAAAALQGFLSNARFEETISFTDLAKHTFAASDAMIEARKQPTK